jgi:hypothetical protein
MANSALDGFTVLPRVNREQADLSGSQFLVNVGFRGPRRGE